MGCWVPDGLQSIVIRRYEATVTLADGSERPLSLYDVVDVQRPNTMSTLQKIGAYITGLWLFLSGEPRESNTEGGIFPAIFGTVLMVLVMTLGSVRRYI